MKKSLYYFALTLIILLNFCNDIMSFDNWIDIELSGHVNNTIYGSWGRCFGSNSSLSFGLNKTVSDGGDVTLYCMFDRESKSFSIQLAGFKKCIDLGISMPELETVKIPKDAPLTKTFKVGHYYACTLREGLALLVPADIEVKNRKFGFWRWRGDVVLKIRYIFFPKL